KESRTRTAVTTIAAAVNTHVAPEAKENAAPGLKTSSKPKTSPSTGTYSPMDRAESAHCFVPRSRPKVTTVIAAIAHHGTRVRAWSACSLPIGPPPPLVQD